MKSINRDLEIEIDVEKLSGEPRINVPSIREQILALNVKKVKDIPSHAQFEWFPGRREQKRKESMALSIPQQIHAFLKGNRNSDYCDDCITKQLV